MKLHDPQFYLAKIDQLPNRNRRKKRGGAVRKYLINHKLRRQFPKLFAPIFLGQMENLLLFLTSLRFLVESIISTNFTGGYVLSQRLDGLLAPCGQS